MVRLESNVRPRERVPPAFRPSKRLLLQLLQLIDEYICLKPGQKDNIQCHINPQITWRYFQMGSSQFWTEILRYVDYRVNISDILKLISFHCSNPNISNLFCFHLSLIIDGCLKQKYRLLPKRRKKTKLSVKIFLKVKQEDDWAPPGLAEETREYRPARWVTVVLTCPHLSPHRRQRRLLKKVRRKLPLGEKRTILEKRRELQEGKTGNLSGSRELLHITLILISCRFQDYKSEYAVEY